jgi:uncharacterized membrane protein
LSAAVKPCRGCINGTLFKSLLVERVIFWLVYEWLCDLPIGNKITLLNHWPLRHILLKLWEEQRRY